MRDNIYERQCINFSPLLLKKEDSDPDSWVLTVHNNQVLKEVYKQCLFFASIDGMWMLRGVSNSNIEATDKNGSKIIDALSFFAMNDDGYASN